MTAPKAPLMLRIPLPGDVDGVQVVFPDRTVTSEQFEHFMTVLDVMRPGLVEQEHAPAPGASS